VAFTILRSINLEIFDSENRNQRLIFYVISTKLLKNYRFSINDARKKYLYSIFVIL
jgi:hypothetical protein